jgi:hypothetical protein
MTPSQVLSCWNWKCALLSATARSFIYLVTLARNGVRGGVTIIAVEMVYVLVTAGLYAGLQQKSLDIRPRWLGNLAVVAGVPGLAQGLEWLTHHMIGGSAPGRSTVAVCCFAALSALFHLHVMRRGAFLTGHQGRTLVDDFRGMPRLIGEFMVAPLVLLSTAAGRLAQFAISVTAL